MQINDEYLFSKAFKHLTKHLRYNYQMVVKIQLRLGNINKM